MRGLISLTFAKQFSAGDSAPSGYIDWHDWASVQAAAGLKQVKCKYCGKYEFPQELCKNKEEQDDILCGT